MLENRTTDRTDRRAADRDDRPPLTRRLGVGLTLLIVGSFGFGVWACGIATNHHAQIRDDINTRGTVLLIGDLAERDAKLTDRIDKLEQGNR